MTWNRNANKRTEKNTILILNYFICVFDVVGIPFVCIWNACIIFIFLMAVRHLGSSLAPDVDGVYGTLLCIIQSSWWLWQLYEVYFAPRKPAVKGKGAKQIALCSLRYLTSFVAIVERDPFRFRMTQFNFRSTPWNARTGHKLEVRRISQALAFLSPLNPRLFVFDSKGWLNYHYLISEKKF